MVLPALIGLAGTIGSGIMGANAQASAAAYNNNANMMNAWLRERERQDSRLEAQDRRFDSYLGGEDAQGNKTMFIPGKGWVVMPSEAGAQIEDAQSREQLQRLLRDLPLQRQMQEANYGDQLEDRAIADNLLDEFMRSRSSPTEMRSRLMSDAAAGINGAFDEATNSAMRGAVRRGTSNVGNILASFARERAGAVGDAFRETGVQARQLAQGETDAARSNLANLYGAFTARARALPGTSFQPMNVNGQANANMAGFSGSANRFGSAGINAAGMRGGEIDYREPMYGAANAVAQGSQSFGNLFDAWNTQDKNKSLSKRLLQNQGDVR